MAVACAALAKRYKEVLGDRPLQPTPMPEFVKRPDLGDPAASTRYNRPKPGLFQRFPSRVLKKGGEIYAL